MFGRLGLRLGLGAAGGGLLGWLRSHAILKDEAGRYVRDEAGRYVYGEDPA